MVLRTELEACAPKWTLHTHAENIHALKKYTNLKLHFPTLSLFHFGPQNWFDGQVSIKQVHVEGSISNLEATGALVMTVGMQETDLPETPQKHRLERGSW